MTWRALSRAEIYDYLAGHVAHPGAVETEEGVMVPGIVAAVTFADGSRVQPTAEGVRAIEHEIRQGRTLAEAVAHIAGGPYWRLS